MFDRRFARNQAVNDAGILLYELAASCMEFLEWELYGTSYKHGLENFDIRAAQRVDFAKQALDLFQEIGLTKEELLHAWDDVQKSREETEGREDKDV